MADLTAPTASTAPTAGMFNLPAPSTQVNTSLTPQISAVAGAAPGLTQEDVDWKNRHSGAGGVARSILGTLGDFLLSHLHMPTMYANSQRQNAFNYANDSGSGGNTDYAGQLGGARAVQRIDATQGNQMLNTIQDNQRADTAAASVADSRQARIDQQREAVRQAVLSRAAGYFNNAATDNEHYQAGRALWKNSPQVMADPSLQAELDNLYPEKFDAANVASNITQYVSLGTQWQQRLTKDRIANQDAQAGVRADQAVADEAGRNSRFSTGEAGRNSRSAASNATSASNTALRVGTSSSNTDKRLTAADTRQNRSLQAAGARQQKYIDSRQPGYTPPAATDYKTKYGLK